MVQMVVINTLPASLHWEPPPGLLGPGTIAMDVAYLPRETAFLAAAKRAGCGACIEGVEMLITQGIASLALWLGQAAPGGEEGLPPPEGLGGMVPVAEVTRAVYAALEKA